MRVLSAVEAANERQKRVLVDKVTACFGDDLAGRSFALWGLAFKPNTDDMREAPSRVVIEQLLQRGARLRVYDPVAMDEARQVLGLGPGTASAVTFASSPEDALTGCDALLIITEWREFKSPDFDAIRSRLRQPLVIDGRNLFEPAMMRRLGIDYRSIGRGETSAPGAN